MLQVSTERCRVSDTFGMPGQNRDTCTSYVGEPLQKSAQCHEIHEIQVGRNKVVTCTVQLFRLTHALGDTGCVKKNHGVCVSGDAEITAPAQCHARESALTSGMCNRRPRTDCQLPPKAVVSGLHSVPADCNTG